MTVTATAAELTYPVSTSPEPLYELIAAPGLGMATPLVVMLLQDHIEKTLGFNTTLDTNELDDGRLRCVITRSSP
jgi:hypothetical protein